MKSKFTYIIGLSVALFAVSCNDFLDELPDNRTTLDNADKIKKMLTSAYPNRSYGMVAELSSDNIDDYGSSNPNSNEFLRQAAHWEHITETNNDDLKGYWEASYKAISNANEALVALEALGYPAELNPLRGEALIARAYNHFILVNLFSNHYNSQTSNTDLGITYMEKPEITLSPKYGRGTVKEVYEKINADIELGLPLVDDRIYGVPKYHFNRAAAYAFAARFNLYFEKWQKAVEYANVVLGENPSQLLRDWKYMASLPETPRQTVPTEFIKAENRANLLLQTSASDMGLVFGAYFTGSRFSHGRNLANRETSFANGPWGTTDTNTFWLIPSVYSATNLDKTLSYKVPYIFQYLDLIAQTGYNRTVSVLFSVDETLLTRAEAHIMLKNYDKGVEDLNIWSKNYLQSGKEISQAEIETFFNELSYSTEENPTLKKNLRPKFALESGTQETLIQCVLHYRRLLTLHEGIRWFDIRRYDIEVPRFRHNLDGTIDVIDRLKVNDLRKTLQVPQDVIDAGLTPNPR